VAGYCEVIEVSHVEDALGHPCGRDTVGECTDCGTRVCNEHLEKCPHCDEPFCITCLSFHESTVVEKKPVHDAQGEVKKGLHSVKRFIGAHLTMILWIDKEKVNVKVS
jgi:hypothetical protein